MNLRVEFTYPPIPWRGDDWHAYDIDTYDGAPDAGPQIVGRGETAEEAVTDFLEQLEEAKHG